VIAILRIVSELSTCGCMVCHLPNVSKRSDVYDCKIKVLAKTDWLTPYRSATVAGFTRTISMMIAQVKNLFNRQWSVMKGRIQMKSNKKRLMFIIALVTLLMSITGTAMAAGYNGSFKNSVTTSGSVVMTKNGYVKDVNSACYHPERPRDVHYGYKCQLWYRVPEGEYARDLNNYKTNSSGGTIRLDWDGYETRAKLQFINTQLPGYTLMIAGNFYGY